MKKNEKEELVITKENYRGYCELYRINNFSSREDEVLFKKTLNSAIIVGLICLGCAVISSLLFNGPSTLGGIVSISEILAFVLFEIGNLGYYFKKVSDICRNQREKLQEDYPNIDIHVKNKVLTEALERVGILTYTRGESGLVYRCIDFAGYENYLKCEEVRNEHLEETKYDKYMVNPEIEEEELEKVKQKVKSLGTR